MIITDSFVMINYPKTGSAFARKMLQQVHHGKNETILEKVSYRLGIKKRPLFLVHEEPNIREVTKRTGILDEHGVYIQIPKEHAHKKAISIKRNIYERYISLYEFRDWERAPWVDKEELLKKYPNYPDITFEEFMELLFNNNPFQQLPEVNNKLMVGPATAQFILFFFKEPFKILNKIDSSYISSGQYKNDMANVHFLDQKDLNVELYNFLRSQGYPKRRIDFIIEAKKINNSTPKGKTVRDYFTGDLLNLVNEKDNLLFNIFNEYKMLNND